MPIASVPTHQVPIQRVSLGLSYIENDSQIWISNPIDKIIIEISNPIFGLLNAGLHTRILNAELVLFCFSAATGT
jgi:hypothetical protein